MSDSDHLKPDKKRFSKLQKASISLQIVGLVLIILGLLSLLLFPFLIKKQIKQNLPLLNGSTSYENWRSPPVPVFVQFWLWNCTNIEEFLSGKEKPIMNDIGPFTYQEDMEKKDIELNGMNDTIFFTIPKTYTYRPDMSNGDIDDVINVVNLPILTLLSIYKDKLDSFVYREAMKVILDLGKFTLFEKHSIRKFLWGYKLEIIDELIKIIDEQPKLIRYFLQQYLDILKEYEKFGIYYMKHSLNGTDSNLYEINNGMQNINDIGSYVSLNGEKYLDYWNTPYCNMLNGSDGSIYHPDLKKTEKACVLSLDIGRSMCATFQKETYLSGILLYHYSIPESELANVSINPDNHCYCTPNCLGSGVLNMTAQKSGAPLIISRPHFYQAADYYQDAIIGVHPDANQHETFLEIEPNTGTSLNVAKRLQINVYLQKLSSSGLLQTDKINTTIFPLFWLNESATADEHSLNLLKSKVFKPINLLRNIRWIVLGFGCCLILIGLIILVLEKLHNSKLIKNDDRNLLIDADDREEE